MDRRIFIKAGGAGVLGSTAIPFASPVQAKSENSLQGPGYDLTSPRGAMLAKARMEGNLDESVEKFGSGTGIVSAVLPNEAIRPMFGFELHSAARLRKQEDGSYLWLHCESVLYTDLKTGEIIDSTVNPLTGERVKVVHVFNNPWNDTFADYEHPWKWNGTNFEPDTTKKIPFGIDWKVLPNGMVSIQERYDLYYPATLKPEEWPRESSGPMNRVTEVFTKFASLEDLQDKSKSSVEYHGEWTRITPWLPWMLMDQAEGHVMYNSVYSVHDNIQDQKPEVLAYLEKNAPDLIHAPLELSGANLASLENYALTQQPAPPRQD